MKGYYLPLYATSRGQCAKQFAFGQHVQITQRHQMCAALYEFVPTNILVQEQIKEKNIPRDPLVFLCSANANAYEMTASASGPIEAQVCVSDVPENARNI